MVREKERSREEEKASRLDCCCVGMSHPLLLALSELTLEDSRGEWDAAAGEVPPCSLLVSAAKEMRDPLNPG